MLPNPQPSRTQVAVNIKREAQTSKPDKQAVMIALQMARKASR